MEWTSTGVGDMQTSVYDPNAIESDAFNQDNMADGSVNKNYTASEKMKLSGVESGAEVNNISDANVTDLTDGGDSTLHYHASDRSRVNHTGTQLSSTISDFDTRVTANATVAANTAVRHTAVTVTDSSEIDFTLTGQNITASLKSGSIDESKLDTSVNQSLDLADSSVQPSDLSAVATSGSYNDLSNKPTIPVLPSTIVESIVAGTNVSVDNTDPSNPVVSASGGGGGGAVDSVNGQTGTVVIDADDIDDTSTTNKFATASQLSNADSAVQPGDLSLVATSGSYNDLSDKPSIPNELTDLDTTVTGAQLNSLKTKVDGIESGAEVNNISDANATDLTDAGDTSLHYHSADRSRANHTGTQTASTISDFSTAADSRITAAIGTSVQGYDSDLQTIGGLSPANDDILQRKAGAWTNRTVAQVKADLSLTKTDVGLSNVDNTSDATKNSAIAALTNKDLTSGTNTFPTFNQNTTGSAATLTTGRTFQTDLASTSAASFNGSANNTHGVTGTLPVSNGGTGATTLTGLVKGNGTSAMTAAVAGTDYLAFSGTTKITVGTTAPASPTAGDLWVDTN